MWSAARQLMLPEPDAKWASTPGMRAASQRPCAQGTSWSSSPCQTSAGHRHRVGLEAPGAHQHLPVVPVAVQPRAKALADVREDVAGGLGVQRGDVGVGAGLAYEVDKGGGREGEPASRRPRGRTGRWRPSPAWRRGSCAGSPRWIPSRKSRPAPSTGACEAETATAETRSASRAATASACGATGRRSLDRERLDAERVVDDRANVVGGVDCATVRAEGVDAKSRSVVADQADAVRLREAHGGGRPRPGCRASHAT